MQDDAILPRADPPIGYMICASVLNVRYLPCKRNVCAYLMDLAMLLLRQAARRELPSQHRVQQTVHSPLYVVPEGSVGMDRVRVETGQQTVPGPEPVGRRSEGKGSIVVAVEVAVAVAVAAVAPVAEECGSLGSQ
jgi:hypothetical protein